MVYLCVLAGTTVAQKAVAEQMGIVGDRWNSKFTMSLGDNFYLFGVEDKDDPHFISTFEYYNCTCSMSVTFFCVDNIRPLLVGNVFLVTRPHVVEKAALFGHYCHYYALRMLSAITTVYPSILEQEIVKLVQEMLR